jgi:negative regulator of replication initiation
MVNRDNPSGKQDGPSRDDVLKRMLKMKPKPHSPATVKKSAKKVHRRVTKAST